MTVGERIRAARKAKGLTQKQLGEACGIAEPTIRRYELGKLNPKFSTLKKIGKALNVTASYLQGYEDKFTAELVDAVKAGDYEKIEKLAELAGLPENSIVPISEDEIEAIDHEFNLQLREREKNLETFKLAVKYVIPASFNEEARANLTEVIRKWFSVNELGQQKILEFIRNLSEIPEYQKDTSL